MLTAFSQSFAYADLDDEYESIRQDALKFEARLKASCHTSVRVDLSDFMFSRDELDAYSPVGLEHAQNLIRVIEEACAANEKNRFVIKNVPAVVFKRGSLGDRRALLDKNRNLVYFATQDGKRPAENIDTLQREDLSKLIKLDFTKAPEL